MSKQPSSSDRIKVSFIVIFLAILGVGFYQALDHSGQSVAQSLAEAEAQTESTEMREQAGTTADYQHDHNHNDFVSHSHDQNTNVEKQYPDIPGHSVIASRWSLDHTPEFSQFYDWTKDYESAGEEERKSLLTEGIRLAKERRALLGEMVKINPERALSVVTPLNVASALPKAIQQQLATRISMLGNIYKLHGVGVNEFTGEPVGYDGGYMISKGHFMDYDSFVYGDRAGRPSMEGTSIHAIEVNGFVAVTESPLRMLEEGEGDSLQIESIECNLESTQASGADPVANMVQFQLGEGYYETCKHNIPIIESNVMALGEAEQSLETIEVSALVEDLSDFPSYEGRHDGIEPSKTTGRALGEKSVLVIRMIPSDRDDIVYTKDYNSQFLGPNNVRDQLYRNSFGNIDITRVDVTPPLELEYTASEVGSAGSSSRRGKEAAAKAGYDLSQYNYFLIVLKHPAISGAGLGQTPGSTSWYNGEQGRKTITHELGHNFGLPHANAWISGDRSTPFSTDGANSEYRGDADAMGFGSGNWINGFNPHYQNYLRWLSSDKIPAINQSGTYRVYQHDSGVVTDRPHALKVHHTNKYDTWLSIRSDDSGYRQYYEGVTFNRIGASGKSDAKLFNTTDPGGAGGGRAPLPPGGGTVYDPNADVYYTVLEVGGTDPDRYADVKIEFGVRGKIGLDATLKQNVNTANLTATEINSIEGVNGAIPYFESEYRAAIASGNTGITIAATAEQIQVMVDLVNTGSFGQAGLIEINGANYTLANIDPFLEGESAGNTLSVDNTSAFWANTEYSQDDRLWRMRYGFGYDGVAGSSGNVYELQGNDRNNAPHLRTTINGLDATKPYEVMVVYISRSDDTDFMSGVQAELDGAVNDQTTLYTHKDPNSILLAPADVWGAFASPIGETTVGKTSFTVDWAGTSQLDRVYAAGILYRIADSYYLNAIGLDAGSGNNNNTSGFTAKDYNGIRGVSGASSANEQAYLDYIANNAGAFSQPATAAEIQTMIDFVNAQEAEIEINGTNFKLVEINRYSYKDIPGNTVRADGTSAFWSNDSSSNADAFWRIRTGFGYQNVPNASGVIYEVSGSDRTGAPGLRTSHSGMEFNQSYEVYALYTGRTDNNSDNAGIRVQLNEAIETNTPVYTDQTSGAVRITQDGVWGTYAAKIGEYKYMTDITLDWQGTDQVNRNHIIGFAYRAISNVSQSYYLEAIGRDAASGVGKYTQHFTVSDFKAIAGVSGALADYEADYRQAILINEDQFAIPASASKVQAMVNRINLGQATLEAIANADLNAITAAGLNAITGVTGALQANETAYRDYVGANPGVFSNPPTAEQIQGMVDLINFSEQWLAVIGSDNPDLTDLRAVILNGIYGVSGAISAHDEAYRDYILNNPNVFSSPATVSEVLSMISAVKAMKKSIVIFNNTYELVELHRFPEGGFPGNTLRVEEPERHWSSFNGSTSDDLWAEREGFGYNKINGTSGKVFEARNGDRNDAPQIRTSVTGLSAGKSYQVYALYTGRADYPNSDAGIRIQLQGAITDDTPLFSSQSADKVQLANEAGVWATYAVPIGQVTGQTGFSVDWDGDTGVERNHAIALAYREVQDVSKDYYLQVIGQDANSGTNTNTSDLTADKLNSIEGVSGALAGNEAAYRAAIIANEEQFTIPATAEQVQGMVNRVNLGEATLSAIASGNTNQVTAAGLEAITGVSGVMASNLDVYIAYIRDATFSTPILASEIQSIIDEVNQRQQLLSVIGSDEQDLGSVKATSLNEVYGVSGAISANDQAYRDYILANRGSFSRPATPAEVQDMINTINAMTKTISIGGIDHALVELHPFFRGWAPGNTLRVDDPSAYWTNTSSSSSDGYWRSRDGFAYDLVPDSSGKIYEVSGQDLTNAPSLRTTVGGLDTQTSYDVYILYTGHTAEIRASLNAAVSNSTPVYRANSPAGIQVTDNQESVWDTYAIQIGEVSNAASFTVDWAAVPGDRSHLIAVAYKAQTLPAYLLDIGRDASLGTNTYTSDLTADNLNSIEGVSGALAANEAAYRAAIIANEEQFTIPATAEQVQGMVNRVNLAEATLSAIESGNTNQVTAAGLEAITGVSGVMASNESVYRVSIGQATFSSPVLASEVQAVIDEVNTKQQLLTVIGEDNPDVSSVNAVSLNNIYGVSGAISAHDETYRDYILNNPNAFSSPATVSEVLSMISTVNAMTKTIDISNDTYQLVEIHRFPEGGIPGNTLRVDNTALHWSSALGKGSSSDDLWEEKTSDAYGLISGASGKVFDLKNGDRADGPVIRTRVTGLDSSTEYSVYVIYTGRADYPTSDAGVRAQLQGDITEDTPRFSSSTPGAVQLTTDNAGFWSIMAASIGSVSGVSEFTVDWAGDTGIERNQAIAVAYATGQPIQTMLDRIGMDADSGSNEYTANLTAAELNSIDGVSGAVADNESAYRDYIASNPEAFSNPATADEVQAMVRLVNALQQTDDGTDGGDSGGETPEEGTANPKETGNDAPAAEPQPDPDGSSGGGGSINLIWLMISILLVAYRCRYGLFIRKM